MPSDEERQLLEAEKLKAEISELTEKRQLELEKLRAEIGQLRRPILTTPQGFAAIVAAIVGFSAAFVQYWNSERKLDLARIQVARAELDVARLEHVKKEREAELQDVSRRRDEVSREESKLRGHVAGLQRFIVEHPGFGDTEQVLERLREISFPIDVERDSVVGETGEHCLIDARIHVTQDGRVSGTIDARNFGNRATPLEAMILLHPLEGGEPLAKLSIGEFVVPFFDSPVREPIDGTAAGYMKMLGRGFVVKSIFLELPPDLRRKLFVGGQIQLSFEKKTDAAHPQ